MAQLKSLGLAGVKFKVGARSIQEDADRVKLAREARGLDFIFVVHFPTRPGALPDAIVLPKYSPCRPAWLEEPVRWQNMNRGLREVRLKTGVRIAAGQSELSAFDCYGLSLTKPSNVS